ncbi:hypothetical protein NC3_24960 [Bacillus altitudinis]|nr:hypothetical protein NC3_24960 [Bacillus altitudinis]
MCLTQGNTEYPKLTTFKLYTKNKLDINSFWRTRKKKQKTHCRYAAKQVSINSNNGRAVN